MNSKRKKMIKLIMNLFCSVVFLVCNFNVAFSEDPDPIIDEVLIVGNKKISKNIIKSKLRTTEGEHFSRMKINKDIKDLYKTQKFKNIEVQIEEKDGQFKVYFLVKEKTKINKVNIDGNSKIKNKDLRNIIKTNKGIFLDEKLIVEDVKKIKNHYEKEGYQQISVDYNVEEIDEDFSIITFNISEGKKVKIDVINIKGAYDVEEKMLLKKIIQTKKKGIFHKGYLEKEKFETDIERLKAYYRHLGYIDMKILDVSYSLNYDKSKISIDIEINEGQQYKIGKILIEGNEKYTDDELLSRTKLTSGDVFIPEILSKDVEFIKNRYFRNGYIDAYVKTKTYTDEKPYIINVNYLITENKESFIDKIRIIGNEKTKDEVIRRELNLSPGDKFDGVKMQVASRRLKNSGLFKNVDVYPDPTISEKDRDLIIEVAEDRTGELGFGAGYSSVDDLIGFLEISQSNFDLFNFKGFTGDAQKLKLRTEFGERKSEFSLNFREPWLFGKKLAFGFKLYDTHRSYETSEYEDDRKGITFSLAKPVFKYTRAEIRYSFENVEIKNVDDDASTYLLAQEGERDVGKVGLKLTRDVRNSFFNASQGSKLTMNVELSGPGGDTYYYRGVLSGDFYFNPWSDHVFISSLKVGGVKEYGDSDDVPIFDRYFLGGAWSIRGFDYRDIGPHDERDEPLGGKFMYYGTFEYVVPLIDQFKFAMFFDYGNLFEEFSDQDDGDEINEGIHFDDINASAGIGLRILLNGQIPIRFDYAWPVITDDYHDGENGKFTFDLGQRF